MACEAPTWCSPEAYGSTTQISSSTLFTDLKCWVWGSRESRGWRGRAETREVTCRPGCLPPRKPILMTQMWRIRKEVYSGAGDLRRWQAPVLENHFNISDVWPDYKGKSWGKRNCGVSGDVHAVLAQAYSFCSHVFQCMPTAHLQFCWQHQCSSLLEQAVQL